MVLSSKNVCQNKQANLSVPKTSGFETWFLVTKLVYKVEVNTTEFCLTNTDI